MITDVNGDVVKEKKYEAFGNLVWEEGTLEDNREFTGKEKDPTGFHYFGVRYYYANIGRFLIPDPHTLMPANIKLENPQEFNSYIYCMNNPLIYVDPLGLSGEASEAASTTDGNVVLYYEDEEEYSETWIVVYQSGTLGVGIFNFELGEFYLIDPSTLTSHNLTSFSAGLGLGAGGAITTEVAKINWDGDPSELGGWGLNLGGFLAVGWGGAGQLASPTGSTHPLDFVGTGDVFPSIGGAGGAGFGIAGMRSYSWYHGESNLLPAKIMKIIDKYRTK
ncbi:RHS repeat-associated core domain-containing protein [candidate division WOR-3 bacterium]|nr:RHS repeat-associated core domain-containing protein [candidate division WOR-3 bacterium]